MKKDNRPTSRTCPVCGQEYSEHPALSRADNETLICPDCGTREALADMGVARWEQERILDIIHGSQNS